MAEPALIGGPIVQGPVLFTHDEAKMSRGEACTTVHKFTTRTQPNESFGLGYVLTEYQFSGETEAHGVPLSTTAH